MQIYPMDPILGGPLFDSDRRDQLFGGSGIDYFVMSRDAKTDTVWDFQDGRDRIDLSNYNATIDSVMIRQIDDTEWTVTFRDEMTRIHFRAPAPDAPPIDLSVDDFVFATDVPDPTPRVVFDLPDMMHLQGTTIPDVYRMAVDYSRDVIHHFELGKDIIDLSAFNTNFAALEFVTRKPGRIVIKVENDVGREHIVVKDANKAFTAADFSADDFVF